MSTKYKIHEPEGIYFLSFATVEWVDVFTRARYKHIVVESLNYCVREKGLIIYAWVIMSNHVHLLVKAKNENLSDIIRDFKKHTAKEIFKSIMDDPESRKDWMLYIFKNAGKLNSNNKVFQFWRQDNHPIEVYSNEVIDQKLDYIHNNPVEAEIVAVPEHYLYSSAMNYAGEKGLVELVLMEKSGYVVV